MGHSHFWTMAGRQSWKEWYAALPGDARTLLALLELAAAFCAISAGRWGYDAGQRSTIVWADLRQSHVEVPALFAGASCVVPEDMYALERTRARAAFEPLPAARSWCLPENRLAREAEAHKLDALQAFMAGEAGRAGLAGIHASHVGVPLKAVLYKDRFMLNPRLAGARDFSHCLVEHTLTGEVREISYPRELQVAYDAPSGASYKVTYEGPDACVVQALMTL